MKEVFPSVYMRDKKLFTVSLLKDKNQASIYAKSVIDYKKKILRELEELKQNHEKIISQYIEPILSQKTKEKIKHLIWMEVMKDGES